MPRAPLPHPCSRRTAYLVRVAQLSSIVRFPFSQRICRSTQASLQVKVRLSASTVRMLLLSSLAYGPPVNHHADSYSGAQRQAEGVQKMDG